MRNLNLRFLLTIEENAASSYGIKQKKRSNDAGTTMFNNRCVLIDVCFPRICMYEVLYNQSLIFRTCHWLKQLLKMHEVLQ